MTDQTFTPTQPILQQVAEPYPFWQDKKVILAGIQIVLSIISANTGVVVPDLALQLLAGMVAGQSVIDLSNGRKAKIIAPVALLLSLSFLPGCVVNQPDVLNALRSAGYPYQQVRLRKAAVQVEGYKDATNSDPDGTHTLTCDYGPKSLIPVAPVCQITE